MREYVTDALVLRVNLEGERNKRAVLYTEALGKISVRVASGTSIKSRLSQHLNPGFLTTARFVEKKDRFTLTDILSKSQKSIPSLRVLLAASLVLPIGIPDPDMWSFLASSEKSGMSEFLGHAGYNASRAECVLCQEKRIAFFATKDHEFFCKHCGSQFPRGEVIYLG